MILFNKSIVSSVINAVEIFFLCATPQNTFIKTISYFSQFWLGLKTPIFLLKV